MKARLSRLKNEKIIKFIFGWSDFSKGSNINEESDQIDKFLFFNGFLKYQPFRIVRVNDWDPKFLDICKKKAKLAMLGFDKSGMEGKN